jgi:Na+-driven multidrug efflux pump
VFFDVPRLGLIGAGCATLVARTIPVLIGIAILLAMPGFGLLREHLAPRRDLLLQLLRVGWPSSAQLVVRIGAILVVFSLINATYTTASDSHTLTAYSICLRLETIVLFLGMGWGAAASSFMGTNLGAQLGSRAHRSGLVAAAYNVLLTITMAWAFIHFADPIIGFFESTPAVIAAGNEYLGIVAPSYAAVAIGVVLSQALTGAGATLASLVVDAAGLLVFAIPAAIVAASVLGLPPSGLWRTIALANVIIALAFFAYYARGGFLEKKV